MKLCCRVKNCSHSDCIIGRFSNSTESAGVHVAFIDSKFISKIEFILLSKICLLSIVEY